jgi:hypothetical protein
MYQFIVVTGLPASGKSTVGAAVAGQLGLPMYDKDQILEGLFESLRVGDAQWRTRLSRIADDILQRQAMGSPGAVIASWWHHPQSLVESGTSTEWLASLPGTVTELYCSCSPQVALDRFVGRQRHAGHLDSTKPHSELRAQFEQSARHGPLGIGRLVTVYTGQPLELSAALQEIDPTWSNPSVERTSTSTQP